MKTRLTFLGTGTSQGVPIIGCTCAVCRSKDPRDNRLRSAVLVEFAGRTILVDAGPDFRQQMLREGVRHLDAILLTHNHRDHTGGLDDVRSLNYIDRHAAEIYCEQNVLEDLKGEYPYAFQYPKYPGAPEWRIHLIENKPFTIPPADRDRELQWVHDKGYCYRNADGTTEPVSPDIIDRAVAPGEGEPAILPIRGIHGQLPVLGFRFGDIAYITDMNVLPDAEKSKLQGLEHVTLNTVGYHRHHSHFSLDEALVLAGEIGARHTWLTHLSHAFPCYDAFCEEIDRRRAELGVRTAVRPAWDGLVIAGKEEPLPRR
ncbi:MAG: MBL fold metallo-hydrolase [Bacteroidales bacterium]|nr:MBL fold metallo-hydrolase [Bacteroidales bacterium]